MDVVRVNSKHTYSRRNTTWWAWNDMTLLSTYLSWPSVLRDKQTLKQQTKGNMKYERYTSLASDIEEAGYACKNIPFEVGSRGHLTMSNKSKLAIIHKLCSPSTKYSQFWKNTSKTSLLCSYSIYLSRHDTWTEIPFLSPVKKWTWKYLTMCLWMWSVQVNSSAWYSHQTLDKKISRSECYCSS